MYGHAASLFTTCRCGLGPVTAKQDDGRLMCARCVINEEKEKGHDN